MDSIIERFKKIKSENPLFSVYLCFYKAVVNRDYTPRAISANFNKCVDRSDYSLGDKMSILQQLNEATKK